MFTKLKARVKTPRFWLIFLGAFLAASLVVNVAALIGVRSVIEPPAKGQFHDLFQESPIENPTNTTGTLLENTVDKLSGGVVPVLLFPKMTNFCGDPEGFELTIGACVDRFDATYISFMEELAINWETNYKAAIDAGLPEEAELINQWERHVAAHEFGHVLQYNYRTETLPLQSKYFGQEKGFLGRENEDMAECYAQLLYPLNDEVASKIGDSTTIEFYGFNSPEKFALCTEEQLDGVKEWLEKINYPLEGRWDGNSEPQS